MTEEDVWRIGGFVGMVFLRGNTEPRARARVRPFLHCVIISLD